MARIKFVEYTGEWPNLCSGVLTLIIDGVTIKFGGRGAYEEDKINWFPSFWSSGGSCGFRNGYSEEYIEHGAWELDDWELPDNLKAIGDELIDVFNANVSYGCCGGCL